MVAKTPAVEIDKPNTAYCQALLILKFSASKLIFDNPDKICLIENKADYDRHILCTASE
jgi:hypothetical protein